MATATNINTVLGTTGNTSAQARQYVDYGAVNACSSINRVMILELLKQALAEKISSVFRYRRHHFIARDIHATYAAGEFLLHAKEELEHANKIDERIVQLGAGLSLIQDSVLRASDIDYATGGSVIEMITENIAAERIAIDRGLELIQRIDDEDAITSNMLKAILAEDEVQAGALTHLLAVRGNDS